MNEFLGSVLSAAAPAMFAVLQVLFAAVASGHAVLSKRGVHAAIGWVAIIWLVPFGGALLYLLFGINRVHRRAAGLRPWRLRETGMPPASTSLPAAASLLTTEPLRHLAPIARVLDTIVDLPLTAGNRITPLSGGTAAYAAMLTAISQAKQSVGFSSYIFDNDPVGRRFVDAFAAAKRRGAAVKVLIDGVGARYSYPRIADQLRAAGIDTAEYLPGVFPLFLHYANLRNHRKILVVDGRIGFTGGMNVRASHLDDAPAGTAIRDLHFQLEGPVVDQLAEIFLQDWWRVTGETVDSAAWYGPAARTACGATFARGIASGPDENFERILWTLLGAVAQAQSRVRIVTPYFLPETALTMQLQLAAMRGVTTEIVIPARNNLKLVEWASLAKIGGLIERGCRVFCSPPPFDHTKLMTVDGGFALIGSANWDPRSFRLNFEFNVECYDESLTAILDVEIDNRIARATALDAAALAARPLSVRLRDCTAWLLSPYL